MARNDWYTIYEDADKYTIQKIDPDSRGPADTFPNSYIIRKTAPECSCPAGHKWCRHKQMLKEFQARDLINKRHIYNYDKKLWRPPLGYTGKTASIIIIDDTGSPE
ncbi:MAG: hypothetical protein E6Q97_36410 [Desulfurellales bacterium]|nr:MAG: hypothetical protein E6Q97_36410 [Desulfurellales bacterium]